MSKANKNMIIKRIVDAVMTVLLLLLMAYQVTGEMAHEWIGMGMTVLVIIHQILNRKWYGALFKGKYNPYRSITTVLNILLIASFALTAFCGMSMSGYAVPFLYGMAPVSFVRRMHLSMSHWAFVLMGLHLGMHIPAMTTGLKLKDRKKTILACIFTCISGIGLWLFLRNSMPDYLFFRVPFAFLDYEKAGWLVFVENLLMLSFWAFIGTQTALVCRNAAGKAEAKKNPLLPVVTVMRSAYRAAGQEDMHSYNLGLRLARNADNSRTGFVAAGEATLQAESDGKILIAYFSWGGNTRGIAEEIQRQTGADIFEITLVEPYSTDYNTVLMEAQEDQHKQARPKLSGHVENMEDYDTVILGYPNWWASIPMPVASFLEEYDFAGKRIIPFCSHGGGRFGQSLTAIAKLAPDAVMGEGLSVHYSGGSELPDEVSEWLSRNGIK